jgi:hypothetical protein
MTVVEEKEVMLTYAIDGEDRLIEASPRYFSFAAENLWAGAGSSIGRPLWDFVAGASMRRVQGSLLRRVRAGDRRVELPFRCDAPAVRREMTIGIDARSADGTVVFSASVLAESSRPGEALLDPEQPRGSGLIEMCGWCDRFYVRGEWMEVETASRVLGLTTASELPRISHGICPDCVELLESA